MDPLAAFSLACGVIQVVDFSTGVVKKCRQLHKDGTLSQNTETEEMARHLTQLLTSLDQPKHGDQGELLKLSERCSALAKDLITELQKLKVSGPQRKRQVIEKAIKSIWKKTAIDDIQKRLDDCRKVLDHRILIDLRKHFDLLSIQQNEGFQDLDLKVRMVITSLAQGPKTFEELKALIQSDTQSIKQHITNELQRQQRDLAHKEYRQRFLESLWFPEIYRRRETIHEAHEKTFQWIYESHKSDEFVHRWDNFVHWLQSGQGTYWIHGKAGSGKSTLMRYVYHDDRTEASLKAWSGSKKIITPGIFFWGAGEALEKSSEGLLRSLIYQILKSLPSLTPSSQILSSSESMRIDSSDHEPIAAWTERRLQATLEHVLRQAQETCRICFFVDGLDEFNGDQDMLIKLIEKVLTADVKVCLSSRSYRSYSEAFGSSSKLRLQDLTELDISNYVSAKLYPLVKTESAKHIDDIFATIVAKAEGVFLWVELVVIDLIKGLKNDDTLEQLQERLESMPSDIEDLYTHMLNKIDKVYRTQAAKSFQMALSNLTGSLFIFALAIFGHSNKISDIGVSDTISYAEEARKKIPTICAGLLEWKHQWQAMGGIFSSTDPCLSLVIPYDESSELAEVEFLQNHAYVEFSHRTARDYFEQSKQGEQFLDANSPPNFNPHISYVNARLTQATLFGFAAFQRIDDTSSPKLDVQDFLAGLMVRDIMTHVCRAEQKVETAQVSLCDDIDRTLAAIHYRHGLPSPKVLRELGEKISVAERQNGIARISTCAEYDDALANLDRQSTSKFHWTVRWGIHSREQVFWVTRLNPSPRSTSTDSFHSADTESRLRENCKMLPTEPIDFISVEALSFQKKYLEQKLGCKGKIIDQDNADYLLCCSVWAFRELIEEELGPYYVDSGMIIDRKLRSCAFTADLLRLGGDCSIYVKDFSNTLWGEFLTLLTWLLFKGDDVERADVTRVCAMTTKAFLENGADIHVRIYREVEVRLCELTSLGDKVALDPKGCQFLTCREESTALHVIQEILGGTPEFGILEKQILNHGGNSSSRWTHITPDWLLDGRRWYRISEQQNHDLKAALRGYGANDDGNNDSMQIRQTWALQIARLYREVCKDNGNPDTVSSSNEVYRLAGEEESRVEASLVLRDRWGGDCASMRIPI